MNEFFSQYQRQILWLANTWLGKFYLCSGWNKKKKKFDFNWFNVERFDEIFPNGFTIYLNDGVRETTFFQSNYFTKKIYNILKLFPLFITKYRFSNDLMLQLKIGCTVTDFYPDAHVESTSVDGYVSRSITVGETWGGLRGGAGNGSNDSIATDEVPLIQANAAGDAWRTINRGIYLFDTSALGASVTIQSATISFYALGAKAAGVGESDFEVCASTPASNTALVNADYSQLGAVSFGAMAYGDWSNSGYNVITLNATGLLAISKTSISKFGTRLGFDLDNVEPTLGADVVTKFQAYFADNGSNEPKLSVTWVINVPVTVSDTISTSDSIDAKKGYTIIVADTISTLDSIKGNLNSNIADVISIAELFKGDLNVKVVETISLSELFKGNLDSNILEVISITDSVGIILGRVVVVTETISTTDSIKGDLNYKVTEIIKTLDRSFPGRGIGLTRGKKTAFPIPNKIKTGNKGKKKASPIVRSN